MHVKATLCVQLCLFLRLCNGAPEEKNDSEGNSSVRFKYTDQEDKFIGDEVLRLIDEHQSVMNKPMWEKIAENHREHWLRGSTGFPQERSEHSLRTHFGRVLFSTPSQIKKKLPKALVKKLTQLHQKKIDRGSDRLGQRSYTIEEENLIFDELRKPSRTSIYSIPIVNSILESFIKKRQEKAPGFHNKRTFHGLRSYLKTMKTKQQFPEDIMKKFRVLHQGSSSSDSSSQDQQTDSRVKDIPVNNDGQVENEEQDDEEWVHEMIEQLQNNKDVTCTTFQGLC